MNRPRTINRSAEVKRVHSRLLEEHRLQVKRLHILADLIEDLRAAIPQIPYFEQTGHDFQTVGIERRPAIQVELQPKFYDVEITTYNMPYDQVVEHIAGPTHRLTGALWHMEVDAEGDIDLYGYVDDEIYEPRISFQITKGMPKCKIIKLKAEPTHWENYEYRIRCS